MADDDPGRGVRVHAATEVVAITRANLLGHIARGLADVIGVETSTLETVFEGFRDGMLDAANFYAFDDEGLMEVAVRIEVDWQRHEVLVASGDELFEIDPVRPVVGQVSDLLEACASFLDARLDEFDVGELVVTYEIRRERRDEFRRRFKTTPISNETKEKIAQGVKGRVVEFSPAATEELSIRISHHR